jgi:hypothetical protein
MVLFEQRAPNMTEKTTLENEKPSTTLPGTVEKIIKPAHPSMPEKAQISVSGADDLYKEIRIENELIDENGEKVALKPGAQVDVTIEASLENTTKK